MQQNNVHVCLKKGTYKVECTQIGSKPNLLIMEKSLSKIQDAKRPMCGSAVNFFAADSQLN